MKTVVPFACCVLLCAGAVTAQITSIPAASLIAPVVLDFDTGSPPPPGPITGTEAYFLNIGLSQVSFIGTGTTGDALDTNVQGNALVAQSGALAITAPSGPMDNITAGGGWGFQINGTATQVGIVVVDQVGFSVTLETYLGGILSNTFIFTGTGNANDYFQDATPFDEVRFIGNSTSGWGIDNLTFGNLQTGPIGPVEYQTNSAEMSVDIDGINGSQYFPTIVQKGFACSPALPQSGTLNIVSDQPGAIYDVVISSSPIVPASGSVTIGGQIVNVNVFQPFVWLSSGTAAGGVTTLPSWFPGATSSEIHIGFAIPGQTSLSLQGVVIVPSAPAGFVLSQATQLDVNLQVPPTSIPGPTTVSGLTTVDVTTGPTCWAPGGIPFYGGVFSTMTVFAGGVIQFGGTDTDTSPSIPDAIGDDGRVGFWTGLDPSEGGQITISSPAPNILRADWNGVFYDAGGPGNTFGIQIDCGTGVIQIDGLGGLVPNPITTSTLDDQWLGISPGITFAPAVTTDPGPAGFGLGLNGVAAVETDMLYEFNDISVSLAGLPPSVAGGMTTLVFTPTTVGAGINYSWAGM